MTPRRLLPVWTGLALLLAAPVPSRACGQADPDTVPAFHSAPSPCGRALFKVGHELGKHRWWRLKPFIADGPVYGFRARNLRSRIALGAERKVGKRLTLGFFYLLEPASRHPGEEDGAAAGAAATFAF
jgi:hypothetical protein